MPAHAPILKLPKARACHLVLAGLAGWLALAAVPVQSQVPPVPLKITALDSAPCVFSGNRTQFSLLVSNSTSEPFHREVRLRLYQAAESTAALHRDITWKTLHVPPGQTILESVDIDIPVVKAETRFLVQFRNGTNTVLGNINIRAFGTNLLHELRTLAGNTLIGVLDPTNAIKPALAVSGLQFHDLTSTGFNSFTGKLAIVGPFPVAKEVPRDFVSRVKALAARGTGVVWIQPPPAHTDPPSPSFFSLAEGQGQIVVVQSDLISRLEFDPQSQLNLVYLCRLAVRAQPLHLPGSIPES